MALYFVMVSVNVSVYIRVHWIKSCTGYRCDTFCKRISSPKMLWPDTSILKIPNPCVNITRVALVMYGLCPLRHVIPVLVKMGLSALHVT